MRVISGAAKGTRLRATRAPEMRPTTDMARQTIFDILGARVRDVRVLDLFAGAGTLGIEALSRGAREAVFVEQDREACSIILQNLEATKLRAHAVIRRAEVIRFLSRAAHTPFDLVFIDPPYSRGLGFVTRVVGKLAAGDWVGEDGAIIVEAEQGHIEWPSGFREIRTKKFGRTNVSMAVVDGNQSDLSRNV